MVPSLSSFAVSSLSCVPTHRSLPACPIPLPRLSSPLFDILGGLLWGCGVTLLGAALGNFSFVQNNIELIFLFVIFLSLLPAIFTAIKGVIEARKSDLPASIDPEDAADQILAGTPDQKNTDVRKRLVAAFQTEQSHEGREAAAIKEQVCSELLDFSHKEDAKAYA